MAKFMLIVHETPGGFSKLSPSEIQQVMEKYHSWSGKLHAAGKLVKGDKLREEGGKIITMRNGKFNAVDGPYAETKEVVGGYFTLRAENYDEAIELLRDCPHLAFGRLELRQTDPMGCGGE
jgi:hypothetical protein